MLLFCILFVVPLNVKLEGEEKRRKEKNREGEIQTLPNFELREGMKVKREGKKGLRLWWKEVQIKEWNQCAEEHP